MKWKTSSGLGGKTKNEQPEAENLDSLTGILKKDIAEARIASMMNRKQGGALFLCDVDFLKRINEQYGLYYQRNFGANYCGTSDNCSIGNGFNFCTFDRIGCADDCALQSTRCFDLATLPCLLCLLA